MLTRVGMRTLIHELKSRVDVWLFCQGGALNDVVVEDTARENFADFASRRIVTYLVVEGEWVHSVLSLLSRLSTLLDSIHPCGTKKTLRLDGTW